MHGRRCTYSTPAVSQPLHSLRVCLRLRARAGRHTVTGQAYNKVSVAPLRCTTPAICSNPDVGTPSSLRSFGWLTSVTHSIVITAHRHRYASLCEKAECCRKRKIRKLDFHAHGSDFTARSAYSGRAKRAIKKLQISAVGDVQSPYGGKPP